MKPLEEWAESKPRLRDNINSAIDTYCQDLTQRDRDSLERVLMIFIRQEMNDN